MTVVIKPDPNEGNKFSVRGMHYTYGLHGIVLAVDYVSVTCNYDRTFLNHK